MPPFNFGGGSYPLLPLGGTLSGVQGEQNPYNVAGSSDMSVLRNILTGSQASTDMFAQQQADQNEEPPEITTRYDPVTGKSLTDVKNMTGDAVAQFMQAIKIYPRVLAGMQGRVDQLAEQEQRVRGNPILNVLATVGGNLAAGDPRLPPLVQALGRSSLMLNPTADQLANERMQLLEQQGKTAAQAGTLGLGLMGLENTRVNQAIALQGQMQREVTSVYKDSAKEALNGKFDPASFVNLLTGAGASESFATAAASHLAGVSKEAQRIAAEKEAAINDRDAKRADAAMDRLTTSTNASMNRLLVGLASREKIAEQKAAQGAEQSDIKAERSEFMKVAPKAQGLLSLEKSSDTLEGLLHGKSEKFIGAIMGNIPVTTLPPEHRAEASRIRAAFFYQLNSVRQAIQAGARFWNPQEYSNLSPLLEQVNKTQQANIGILQAVRDFIKNERQSVVETYTDVDWKKRAGSLGRDAPDLIKKWDELQGLAGGTEWTSEIGPDGKIIVKRVK